MQHIVHYTEHTVLEGKWDLLIHLVNLEKWGYGHHIGHSKGVKSTSFWSQMTWVWHPNRCHLLANWSNFLEQIFSFLKSRVHVSNDWGIKLTKTRKLTSKCLTVYIYQIWFPISFPNISNCPRRDGSEFLKIA